MVCVSGVSECIAEQNPPAYSHGAAPASAWSAMRPGPVLIMLLGALVAWLAVSWWRRHAKFRELELAMPGPRSLPVVGSAWEFVGVNENNILDRLLHIWGGRTSELSRCTIFNNLVVFVTDPDHIGQVVRGRHYQEKALLFYPILHDIMGQGLVTAGGAHWKRHRAIIQPVFHLETLESFVDTFAAEAGQFVERLRPHAGQEVEYNRELMRNLAYSLLQTSVNTTDRDKADIEFLINAFPRVLQGTNVRTFRPWLWPSSTFSLTTWGREQTVFMTTIKDLMNRLLKQSKQSGEAGKDDLGRELGFRERKSFADLILDSRLSNHEIIDEMLTLAGAAVETSATTLTFALKMMSIRPDIQKRVYDELCDVFQGSDRPVTTSDLPRLQYLERVIKETLRMFPAFPFVGRNVPEDMELGGKLLPAKTSVFINIIGVHRNPKYHPDPMNFDPDRFLPERVASWRPYIYLPFSSGLRNCIGKQYAMMQMKTIMATTLRAYSIQPAADGYTHPSQFPVSFGITLSFVGGCRVRFEPRK